MSTEKVGRVIPFPHRGLASADARTHQPRHVPPAPVRWHRTRVVAATMHAALPDAIILVVTLASMTASALLTLTALGLRVA